MNTWQGPRTNWNCSKDGYVHSMYTFLRNMEAAELATLRKHREDETHQWNRTRENPGLKKQLEVIASGIVESERKPGANDERKGAG